MFNENQDKENYLSNEEDILNQLENADFSDDDDFYTDVESWGVRIAAKQASYFRQEVIRIVKSTFGLPSFVEL